MLTALTKVANERFDAYLETLGGAPRHRVEFSPRITTSWALIYYRRHLVRLSPYLFLLEPQELRHGTHWRELDATLRHEAAHAVHFAATGETGHSRGFHDLLGRLGVKANGSCDLGPENLAFRYVYACPSCGAEWQRRAALHGNWSCGICAPGRYEPAHRMVLRESLPPLHRRLSMRAAYVDAALSEALAMPHPSPLPTLEAPAAAPLRATIEAAAPLRATIEAAARIAIMHR